jgi:hypothetical protein
MPAWSKRAVINRCLGKTFLKIDAIIKELDNFINTEAIAQTLNTSLRSQYTPDVIVIEI